MIFKHYVIFVRMLALESHIECDSIQYLVYEIKITKAKMFNIFFFWP